MPLNVERKTRGVRAKELTKEELTEHESFWVDLKYQYSKLLFRTRKRGMILKMMKMLNQRTSTARLKMWKT